jgi:hypothetical protein
MGPEYETALDVLRGRSAPTASTAPHATEAAGLVYGVLVDSAGEPAHPLTPADLLAALTVLRHLREELASWEPLLITAARERGASWVSLAPALGVTSRQAAERRYLRLRPSVTGESTREGRVRAERDRRAGDRAVEAWARQNSAVLRQLAGQVSALDGLNAPARASAELVGRALADDDAASLLSPLADSHDHLRAHNSALADQIKSVTDHTERLRRTARDQRAKPPQ